MPSGVTTLAEPTPPFSAAACAPVPAPTVPWRTIRDRAAAAARRPNSASGRLRNTPPAPRSKTTAAGTIGTTWCGCTPIRNPRPRCSSQAITPPAASKPYALPPVRQIAVDLVHHVERMQRIGLTCARSTTAHVDTADGLWRRQHHGGPGQPAPSGALVVADLEAGDVGEVVAAPDPHDAPPQEAIGGFDVDPGVRDQSSSSTNSSAW